MSMKFRSDDKFCFHRSCNTFLGKVILICRCQLNVKATGTPLARTRNERSKATNILIDLLLWLATGPFSVVGLSRRCCLFFCANIVFFCVTSIHSIREATFRYWHRNYRFGANSCMRLIQMRASGFNWAPNMADLYENP